VARFAIISCLFACAAFPISAMGGSRDPAFSQIPFEKWLSQGDQTHMRWSARVSDPELSVHQRLAARVVVQVDGAELAKRRGKGQFLVLVQVNDEQGRAFQNHQEMNLEHIEAGIKANDALFSQLFFVLPGDYRVSIAIFATATEEHSVIRRKLHVPALKNDPLPDAWRDLPAVEFLGSAATPDSWYLPSITGKLALTVEPREPMQVDLIANLTPSERLMGSNRVQNRTLGALLPATKVLSQVEWRNVTFGLTVLDLARQRVTWSQENGQGLDWSNARASFAEINPGIIDVKSLEKRAHSAEFFLDEIRRRISAPKRPQAVIILSGAVEFETVQEVRPVSLNIPSNTRVFYIRYQPLPPIFYSRPGGGFSQRRRFVPVVDQLEPLLKPLEPRLFDVATPEQFRKALAAVLTEIAKR
jgi:hypothetical protein